MNMTLKTLILDSLMSRNGESLTPDVMHEITVELVGRIMEIAAPRMGQDTLKHRINMDCINYQEYN